jgi:hypothetical protein
VSARVDVVKSQRPPAAQGDPRAAGVVAAPPRALSAEVRFSASRLANPAAASVSRRPGSPGRSR